MQTQQRKNRLAAFDLDGTLFDTREVNYRAYAKAFSEEGYTLDKLFYEKECNGRYYKDYIPIFIPDADEVVMERIHNRKKSLYKDCLRYARQNIHLFKIVELMRQEYHTAIVTTASKTNCMDILSYFGCQQLFDLILTHNDIKKSKPDPEGYLLAMKYFRVTPENTVVFEDSEPGIEAAIRSGASVLRVYDYID